MMRQACFLALLVVLSGTFVGCGGSTGTSVSAPPATTETPEQIAEKNKEVAKPYDGKANTDDSEAAEHSN